MGPHANRGDRVKSLLDPAFKYTPACATDIRKTFARVRKEREQAEAKLRDAIAKVQPLKRSA